MRRLRRVDRVLCGDLLSQEVDVFFSAAVDSPTGCSLSDLKKVQRDDPCGNRVGEALKTTTKAANKNTLKKPTKRP